MTPAPFRWPKTTITAPCSADQGAPTQAGFTLIESLVVVTIIGIIATLALPSWLGFLDQRRVNMTQGLIYQALRQAQGEASQRRQSQQFSLREQDDHLEWASHPVAVDMALVTHWTPLIEGVGLASEDNTLLRRGGIYYVKFDHEGNVVSQLGRITVVGRGDRLSHRCVVVSTLIGAMRRGQGQTTANADGRYCY
ncbi:MAG: type II secretion system protein [Leptolyngbya sp.]|nr:type II secretion system protein [Leptolyngbya sp.]